MQNSPAARQAVVVGAGFAGAVTARELADHGYQVKILERRAQIGGNMYDYPRDGVLTHLYGPHIFHTGNQKVFEYLSRFTRWVPYEHRVLGRIKGKYVPIPFNFRSMEELFPSEEAAMLREKLTAAYPGQDRVSVLDLVHNPDPDIARLGEFVFENVFVHYTAKQWGMPVEQVDTSVINRVPVVLGYDDRYFRDPIQMMPEQGFTPLFEAMLDHENITVELDTDARSRLTLTEDGQGVAMLFEWTGPGKRSIQQAVSGMRLERVPLLERCRTERAPVFLPRQDREGNAWHFTTCPLIRRGQVEGFLCIENAREHPADAALFSTLIPCLLRERDRFRARSQTAEAADQLMGLPDLRSYMETAYMLDSDRYSSLGAVCLEIPDMPRINGTPGPR